MQSGRGHAIVPLQKLLKDPACLMYSCYCETFAAAAAAAGDIKDSLNEKKDTIIQLIRFQKRKSLSGATHRTPASFSNRRQDSAHDDERLSGRISFFCLISVISPRVVTPPTSDPPPPLTPPRPPLATDSHTRRVSRRHRLTPGSDAPPSPPSVLQRLFVRCQQCEWTRTRGAKKVIASHPRPEITATLPPLLPYHFPSLFFSSPI